MNRVLVPLPIGPYEVLVGGGILDQLATHLRGANISENLLVLTQPRIQKVAGRFLGTKYPTALIPDGERAKTLGTVGRVLDQMAAARLDRQSALLAFGGGVVGDVAGFAASIYMRGISVVHVPTTLLAQVDSSIGGKTGVNHRAAKNLIGTFHQPRLVLSDPKLLGTLPQREYASGLYEALKYGVIRDPELFNEFECRLPGIAERDERVLERLVTRCAGIKARIVGADELETDLRGILNFGHTIGHGIEAASGYTRIRHGEAVGYGMIGAARLAHRLGWVSAVESGRIENVIRSVGNLPSLHRIRWRDVLKAVRHDKKTRGGRIYFVLPRAIGEVEITGAVPSDCVAEVVRELVRDAR